MRREKEVLQSRIAATEQKLAEAPDGLLTYHKVGGVYRYYVEKRRGGKRVRVYLNDTTEDNELKVQLLAKRLRTAQLQDDKNELEAIEAYLKKRKEFTYPKIFDREPIRKLLMTVYEKWAGTDYERNTYHSDGLKYEGANGVKVASKSEKDITWGLADAELPNRYEQKYVFEGRNVYPDFTIIHPVNGKVVLWEHFGRMDDDDYARRALWKLSLYMRNGYFPGENLIVTFEDKTHPLTNRRIQSEIEYCFGDWLEIRKKKTG